MISILLPTRNRSERLKQTVASIIATARGQVEILCYITPDDHSYMDYSQFAPAKFIIGPRLVMSDLWNALIPYAAGDIFMQCADDVIFRTEGWDEAVEKVFAEVPDKILLAFCDDGGPNGKKFSSLPFVSRRWVEVVGYFTGPGFAADFSDTWPFDVAVMIGRLRFIPDVLIEHCHHLWGKASLDQTYEENRARYQAERPDLKYVDTFPERYNDAHKLRRAITVAQLDREVSQL